MVGTVLPRPKRKPQGHYRVDLMANGEYSTITHNVRGQEAFRWVAELREAGRDASWSRQRGRHAEENAEACAQCRAERVERAGKKRKHSASAVAQNERVISRGTKEIP